MLREQRAEVLARTGEVGEENGTIAVLVPLVAAAAEQIGPGRDLPLADVLAAAQAELTELVAT